MGLQQLLLGPGDVNRDEAAGGELQYSSQTGKSQQALQWVSTSYPVLQFLQLTLAESKGETTTLFDHPEIRNDLQRIFSRVSFDLFVLIWTQYLELRIGMPHCESVPSEPKITVLLKRKIVYT